MAIIFSFGKWGGIYICKWRICLGWMAVSILQQDGDDIIGWAVNWIEQERDKEVETI